MTDDDTPRCKMCEVVGGVFGILLGTVLLFISFDILTGGSLSSLVSGGKETSDDESSSGDES